MVKHYFVSYHASRRVNSEEEYPCGIHSFPNIPLDTENNPSRTVGEALQYEVEQLIAAKPISHHNANKAALIFYREVEML